MTTYADEIPDTGAVFTYGKSRFADNEPSHFFIKNDPVVAISCGDEHSAVICQGGRVFVFGGNAWGQLGLGHSDEVTRPSCVKWLKPHPAIFVACGRAHTVFVTDQQAIYTAGNNDEGQLGTGDTESHSVPQYVEIEEDGDNRIRQVSAGSDHTAILTMDGRVFVTGSNTDGQLGLGDDSKNSLKLTRLNFMEKIAFIECGYHHTVFITTQGVVFVTGDNEGQKLAVSNPAMKIFIPEVLPIDIPIRSACCGASHTFLLSMDESKILAFGSNEHGQLGLPKSVEFVTQPTEIDMDKLFDGFQLKLVACGAMHTAFVTDNGLLYTCGESRNGKLCLDDTDSLDSLNVTFPNQYMPKRVSAMNGFIVDNVACGGCHTLLTATRDFTNEAFPNHEQVKEVLSSDQPSILNGLSAMLSNQENVSKLDISNIIQSEEHTNLDDHVANTTNCEDTKSIDSLEANVSGSHIVNINELDNAQESSNEIPNDEFNLMKKKENKTSEEHLKEEISITNNLETPIKTGLDHVENNGQEYLDTLGRVTDDLKQKLTDNVEKNVSSITKHTKNMIEAIEEKIVKTVVLPPIHTDEIKSLHLPDEVEIKNSPPPRTPQTENKMQNYESNQLHVTKNIEDSPKSDSYSKSENETIICGSDNSSPKTGKNIKTTIQAVLPIVRNEDIVEPINDSGNFEVENEVVVNKLQHKGRFTKIFETLRDKENSCMGKGKIIEETVKETTTKSINKAEETIHNVEETIETEIRNQTNSRTCEIL